MANKERKKGSKDVPRLVALTATVSHEISDSLSQERTKILRVIASRVFSKGDKLYGYN